MFQLNTTIKSVDKLDSGELRIFGKASTPSVDRARDIILAEAWGKGGIKNYEKNPILLFNHNYDEVIGKVTQLSLTDQGLEVEALIIEGSRSHKLIESGVLKTFSVGFLIKDADYNKATDGLIIKDAELLEVSVVSVPCNQDATFELKKSYSPGEFEDLKQKFGKPDEDAAASSTNIMNEEEVKKLIEDAQAKSAAPLTPDAILAIVNKALAEKEAADKAKALSDAAEAKKMEEIEERVRASVGADAGERISKAVEEAVNKSTEEAAATIAAMADSIKEHQAQIKSFQEARGGYFPGKGAADAKSWTQDPELRTEAIDTFILSKALGKGIDQFDAGVRLLEKVNTQSSVQVSSNSYEQLVSNEIYRDIQMELVIAPMFREVQLRSASQLLTIAPDTGYATHQTTGSSLPGTKPNGLLNNPDGSQPYVLSETTLRTDKLVSKAYLANDTEEDVIIPLLPIIRDAMIRQHAKSVDQMILTAGAAGSIYETMVSDGLIQYTTTQSRSVNGPSAGSAAPVTGAHLLSARSAMGKYGIDPRDIIYIVGVNAYFQLLKDEAFYNNDEVGTGTKVTGEVGRMFGSRILVSAEMPAVVATGKAAALAVNTRNFVIPRLRGLTSESEYSVDGQHWLLATTQRLGFTEVIPNAKSVVALNYVA